MVIILQSPLSSLYFFHLQCIKLAVGAAGLFLAQQTFHFKVHLWAQRAKFIIQYLGLNRKPVEVDITKKKSCLWLVSFGWCSWSCPLCVQLSDWSQLGRVLSSICQGVYVFQQIDYLPRMGMHESLSELFFVHSCCCLICNRTGKVFFLVMIGAFYRWGTRNRSQ